MTRSIPEKILLFTLISITFVGDTGPQDDTPVQNLPVQQIIQTPPKSINPPPLNLEDGMIPAKITIPSLSLTASVEKVGVLPNGAMDTPKKDKNVGWLATGTQPGDIGNAVMAGHVDNRRGAAVFYPLKKLSIGDEIHVMNEQQKQLTFVVNDKKIYRADQAPIKKIFGAAQTANLNLITCTGYFDRKLRTHLDRLVIYATLKK